MARNVWDEPIDKNIPWDGNEDTNNLPVRGSRVEEFLKGSLNSKIGVLFYDTTNNRYLAFADEEERDKYIADPTQTGLVLGTFDAPFNYTAEINLASKTYNAVFIGSSGHYIDFTFDVKNKQGASTGESVIIKYTFMRGSNKREVSEIKPFGSAVHFNIDKYLAEGTNTIIVSVTGQNTLAATSVAITYEVVNLQLNDMLDISKVYDLTGGTAQLEVPYSISGYGTKIVEWYIDGEMLDYVRAEDEIVESNTTRTKHITLSNLSQGVHSLQFRAYTTVNGELFYTSTLYRDIIVYTGVKSDMIIAIATSIPSEYGIIGSDSKVALYDMVQYVPYTLRFATYSPSNTSNVEVKVKVDNSVKATLNSNNGIENNVVIVPTTSGTKSVEITAGNTKYEIEAEVAPTTMNIQEITNGLVMDFVASEKTNNSSDRDVWEYGDYKGTLNGFAWNNASGWVNNRLEMTSGATFEINYAPLSNTPTSLGKTIEIEWSTKNVKDDNAIICDLRNSNGVGIVIYATKVSMTSADGVTIETEYKSDENVRIAFVINRSTGSTYQRMSFIYANGILSRGDKWALTDSYTSDTLLKFQATDGAEVSLKSIRIYDDALSSDNILNNYILYRDTVEEMMEVYDRNDVYEENRDIFSPSKMSSRLPVMIVTGDIPTLENTSDKDTQITVDIEYTNLQDPSRSFKMVGAAMRPQGTSSMGYPKKNFRIYTQKLDTTVVYDATGNVVADKLYSFKQGAQPVNCWCLKADYAESSGTHNTGIARLWNEALYNAQIDGEYKLRTEAQRVAAASGYEYDVRTTIDGFPILLFYRPSANDDVIFIGKYNFNNDKSTESVFGFKGIPNFDNTHMQCWEVLNNGNPLALFTTTENFDTMWSEAFESRYPDTKTPDISGLKAFAQWMSTVSQEDFSTEKWAHMDVYKMAAYWVYLMRHAGADQFVKNAMFTSEDGEHFYYILYDNDTINGLINTGHLTIRPTDTRQTMDASGSYVFAGHDSRLWNMLEADEEFINIVAKVDNALYSAGISYDNTIRIFDEEQADKWVEKVYNQDATYKYISPYVDKGVDNLFMLQGKRDLHRRWWLAKRFAIYDAKYVSGQYKSLSVELKCINGTPAGQEFTVTAGYPIDYGYGINNLPRKFGVPLEIGESYTFSTSEVVNLGDPIRIYGAPNIAELDLSKMADRLAVVTISNVYEKALGTRLTKLVVGSPAANNLQVDEISGLRQALMLDYLDIQGMQALTSLDLSAQLYFKTLKAHNSSIATVTFAKGAPVERIELPASMRVLSLEQLPYITTDNIILEDTSNISGIIIRNCPNASNKFTFVYDWYNKKTANNSSCVLVMDNVNWTGVKGNQLTAIANIALAGGTLSLKGKVKLTQITKAQGQTLIKVFGPNVFNEDSDFFVDAPLTLTLIGPASILEGENSQYEAEVYPPVEGTLKYSLVTGRTGCSINADTGVLTTVENGIDTSNIVVRATFTPSNGEPALTRDMSVSIIKRTYPSNVTISGNGNLLENTSFEWSTDTQGVNGNYTVEWVLEGAISSYYNVENNGKTCMLVLSTSPTDTIQGNLVVKIIRNVDKAVMATASASIYHTMSSLTISITSNQSNDTTIAATKASVKYEGKTISASNGQVVKIPIGVSVTVIFPEVTGYTQPDSQSYVSTYDSKSISVTYNTTIVKVTMSDNQTSLNDIASSKATVKYNSTSISVSPNGTVKVPFGNSAIITWSSISGYRTPDSQTFIAAGTSMQFNGLYQTELLTVNVTSDIDLPTSFTITVSGVGSQTSSSKTYKVPFGASYTISASSVSGYKTPATQSYTANSTSRSVTITYYEFVIGTWITIDQTITDPATMISGEINGEHIQLIRQNSHRYLGKYTGYNEMTICQLDDTDSNLFHNGFSALLNGTHGDVFMKLPRFWYKAIEKEPDVWNIGFYYGEELPELADWMKWDGNDLIGVYKATFSNSLAYSVSGKKTTDKTSTSHLQYAKDRGDGFSFVKWKHHCVLAFLFYAKYGTTNSQAVLEPCTEDSYIIKTGFTDGIGMQDTIVDAPLNVGAENYWGLENWTGSLDELFGNISNISTEPESYIIEEDDGTTRILRKPSGVNIAGCTKKMLIGPYLDLVSIAGFASATTGYCDINIYPTTNTKDGLAARAGFKNRTDYGISSLRAGKSGGYGTSARISFRGNIIEIKNSSDFINL